jgi:hypothetical protein
VTLINYTEFDSGSPLCQKSHNSDCFVKCLIYHKAGFKNIRKIRFNLTGSEIQSIPSLNGGTVQPNL